MTILWTDPSLDDLRAIRDYISRDSETYAANFIETILSAVEQLSEFLCMGRIVPEASTADVRELLFGSYRIIYRVQQDAVLILGVIHGYRDLSGMPVRPWEIR